jgi:hypothetical protein
MLCLTVFKAVTFAKMCIRPLRNSIFQIIVTFSLRMTLEQMLKQQQAPLQKKPLSKLINFRWFYVKSFKRLMIFDKNSFNDNGGRPNN